MVWSLRKRVHEVLTCRPGLSREPLLEFQTMALIYVSWSLTERLRHSVVGDHLSIWRIVDRIRLNLCFCYYIELNDVSAEHKIHTFLRSTRYLFPTIDIVLLRDLLVNNISILDTIYLFWHPVRSLAKRYLTNICHQFVFLLQFTCIATRNYWRYSDRK